MNHKNYVAIALCVTLSSFAFADDTTILPEVVVSAHNYERPAEKVASSVTVINEQEIMESGQTQLSELLKTVAGVDVVRNGALGGSTSVFLRGGNSEHTLVVIDGVEINNPASTAGAFNFVDLTLDNIERIEILRGPQGLIYGSNAIGGVISITTKLGRGTPSGFAQLEGGSFNTFTEKVGFSGSSDDTRYSFSYSRQDTDGISSASEEDGNSEDDGYENNSFSGRLNFDVADNLVADLAVRYSDSTSDIDNTGGAGGDDLNRFVKNQETFIKAGFKVKWLDGRLTQNYSYAYTDNLLRDHNDPDSQNPVDILRSRFDGKKTKIDIQNVLHIHDQVTAIFGLQTEKEQASSTFESVSSFGPFNSETLGRDVRTNGYYGEMIADITDQFSVTAGVRADDHDKFGGEVTYRIAPTYLIESTGTKVTGNIGTGFKAPSLFQLFSDFGNEGLQPEESTGWEVGIEQAACKDTVVMGVTYFRNRIDQLITFDPQTFIFNNIDRASIWGIEAFVREQYRNWTFGADYTYTDAEDAATDNQLLRRARHKVGATVNYSFCGAKCNANLRVVHVGKRPDTDFSMFPAARVDLDSYTVANISASYKINANVTLIARAENIFDEEYEEVLGFGTPGAAGYGGIRVTF